MLLIIFALLSATHIATCNPNDGMLINKSFYSLCAKDRSNCIGAWWKNELENFYDCIDNKNCTTVIGFEKNSDSYTFHLMVVNRTYIAVGFSDTQTMGDDCVVQCVKEPNGVGVYMSYNHEYKNYRVPLTKGLTVIHKHLEDLTLYCKFKLDFGTRFGEKLMFLPEGKAQLHYVTGASGFKMQTDKEGNIINIGGHKGHVYTPNKLTFGSGSVFGASIVSLVITFMLCFF